MATTVDLALFLALVFHGLHAGSLLFVSAVDARTFIKACDIKDKVCMQTYI